MKIDQTAVSRACSKKICFFLSVILSVSFLGSCSRVSGNHKYGGPWEWSSASADLEQHVQSVSSSNFEGLRGTQTPAPDLAKTIAALNSFTEMAVTIADTPKNILAPQMNMIVESLDALALDVHLPSAEKIVSALESAHRKGYEAAAAASSPDNKGLWIDWSEKVFLTKSALQKFFSEILVTALEKKLNQNSPKLSSQEIARLSGMLHPEHERRIISQLRLHPLAPEIENTLIQIIAASGGPLARLYIFQRFISQPSLSLAQALAKSKMPRVRDLLKYDSGIMPASPVLRNPTPDETTPDRMERSSSLEQEWKELRETLKTIEQIPAKYAQANAKWVDLHRQVSERLDTLPADQETLDGLKSEILQSYVQQKPRPELSYKIAGTEFREGDIVLIQSGSTGGLWETLTQSRSLLSHLMMVTFSDDRLPFAIEMNFGHLLISPLDIPADHFTVVRAESLGSSEREALQKAVWKMLGEDISYDFDFDRESGDELYCSELAAEVFKRARLPQQPFPFPISSWQASEILKFAGSTAHSFFVQGSYLASKDFSVVAEKVQSDPFELIRGSLVLEAFRESLVNAREVRLDRHPQAHKFLGLSMLTHTLEPQLRRAIGPQPFVRTAMTLDDLIRNLESDARSSMISLNPHPNTSESPIKLLKNATMKALTRALPSRMRSVFPH
jgi:hypothetical protein